MNLMNENRDCLYVCYQSIFWVYVYFGYSINACYVLVVSNPLLVMYEF